MSPDTAIKPKLSFLFPDVVLLCLVPLYCARRGPVVPTSLAAIIAQPAEVREPIREDSRQVVACMTTALNGCLLTPGWLHTTSQYSTHKQHWKMGQPCSDRCSSYAYLQPAAELRFDITSVVPHFSPNTRASDADNLLNVMIYGGAPSQTRGMAPRRQHQHTVPDTATRSKLTRNSNEPQNAHIKETYSVTTLALICFYVLFKPI